MAALARSPRTGRSVVPDRCTEDISKVLGLNGPPALPPCNKGHKMSEQPRYSQGVRESCPFASCWLMISRWSPRG